MLESLQIIKESLLSYIGTGFHIILYVFSIIYIFVKEKDKKKRIFLVYFQLLILFVLLNPIFNKIVGKFFNSKTYVRMFWCIPYGITISYMFVDIFYNIKNNVVKYLVLIASVIVICITGKLIYLDGNFIKVDNIYKLPEESVDVTKIISNDSEEYKKAYVPTDIVAHIRQIDANIILTYKRNPNTYANNEYVMAMSQGDVEKMDYLAQREKSNYIVIDKSIKTNGTLEEFDYIKIGETDNYVIYKKK